MSSLTYGLTGTSALHQQLPLRLRLKMQYAIGNFQKCHKTFLRVGGRILRLLLVGQHKKAHAAQSEPFTFIRADNMKKETAFVPRGTYGVLRGYSAGTQVCGQGENPVDVYLIRTGVIKLIWTAPDGEEAIVGLRWPGSLLGMSSVIASEPMPASVVTLSPATLEQISRAQFLDLLRSDYSLSLRVHEMQSREILEQARAIAGVPVESAKQHSNTFLSGLVESMPGPVCVPDGRLKSSLSEKDLAALPGIERAHLSHLLHDLAAEAVISLTTQSKGRACWTLPKDFNPKAFDFYPCLNRVRQYFERNHSEPFSLAQAASVAALAAISHQ